MRSLLSRSVTGGRGRLEDYQARRRAERVSTLVPADRRKGRILDIGCRFFRHLPGQTDFGEKYGLDKGIGKELRTVLKNRHDLVLVDVDLECSTRIPFAADFFDVVTMLSAFEHIQPAKLHRIVAEIERVLKPGGLLIMTTPAGWTVGLLECLVRTGIVKRVKVMRHKAACKRREVRAVLEEGGFSRTAIKLGYFGFFMNIWARARKVHNRFELEEFELSENQKQIRRKNIFKKRSQ